MARTRRYKRRRVTASAGFWNNQYARIIGVILVIVAAASFYIYQRVWVRNLIEEVEDIQKRNEEAQLQLAAAKAEWISASSIANIEKAIGKSHLGLEPTLPSQNFTLLSRPGIGQSRYAGLIKAFENLKSSIPLVSPNEADAGVLFEEE
jgi:hypothetical protein